MLGTAEAGPKFAGVGEGAQFALLAGEEIEFDNARAVGGIGEREAQNSGVIFGLLETICRLAIRRLGLDHGENEIAGVAEKVIGTFARAATGATGIGDNAAIRETPLLGNRVRVGVPPGR